nr:coiled-coil domain-containing protein 187 [Zootoca vivipara]
MELCPSSLVPPAEGWGMEGGGHLAKSKASIPGHCHIAQKLLEALKGKFPPDKKLQELQQRILEQQRRCLVRALGGGRPKTPCPGEGAPTLGTRPLKRKVGKVAAHIVDTPDPASEGRRGMPGKEKRRKSHIIPPPEMSRKERGAHLFGPSAWREGQKLARRILGQPQKYPKPGNSSSLWMAEKGTPEPGKGLLTMSQVEQSSLGRRGGTHHKDHAMERGTAEAGEADGAAGLNKICQGCRSQEYSDLEREAGNLQRQTGSKGKAGCSNGMETKDSPKVHSASADTGWMCPRILSAIRKGRMKETSRMENQPRLEGQRRRIPYNLDEVREFMVQKMAERRKMAQEEKRALREAQEARKRRLKEVERKQKEAFSNSSRRKAYPEEEVGEKFNRGSTSTKYTKCHWSPESEVSHWVRQTSHALLRGEVGFPSEECPEVSKIAEVTRSSDLFRISVSHSPLRLRDLDVAPPELSRLSPHRSKQEKVRAIALLARSLSERLENETKSLRARNRPLESSGDQGWPTGPPSLSEGPSATSKPEAPPAACENAFWEPNHFRSPSLHAQENSLRPEGAAAVATQVAMERIWAFLSIARVHGQGPQWDLSSEAEEQHAASAKNIKERWKGFFASRGPERGPSPETPGASPATPHLQFLTRRPQTSPLVETCISPHQNFRMEDPREKPYHEKIQGLQPKASAGSFPPQGHQVSGLKSPPTNQLLGRTIPAKESGEMSETTDPTSQDVGEPVCFERALVLGTEEEKEGGKKETSGPGSFSVASSGSSGGRSSRRGLQEEANNTLGTKCGKVLSHRDQVMAAASPGWKPQLGCQEAEHLNSSREGSAGPILEPGGLEITDHVENEEERCRENVCLTENPKEDNNPHSSTSDRSPGSLSSETSSARSFGFSQTLGSPRFGSEFLKAHAVLVNISRSSLSVSDFEEEDSSQDTDVSLPEEFAFQEQPPDSCSGNRIPTVSAVPQAETGVDGELLSSGSRHHFRAASWSAHSNQDGMPPMCSQEKAPEGRPESESDSVVLSNRGRPRPLLFQAQTPETREEANSSRVSDQWPHANSKGKMLFHIWTGTEKNTSSPSWDFQHPEGQDPLSTPSKAEVDGEDRNTSKFKSQHMPVREAPEVSLKSVNPITDQLQDSLGSSKSRSVLESAISCTENSGDESCSSNSRLCEGAAAQITGASLGDEEDSACLHSPETTDLAAEGNQNAIHSQSKEESGVAVPGSSSPKPVEEPQVKSCLLRSDEATFSDELLSQMKEDLLSPFDDFLTSGSNDMPSLTEQDVSFSCQGEDLPAPHESPSEQLLLPP